MGGTKEKNVKWYGVRKDGKTFLFENLSEDYLQIFDSLREGEVPSIEKKAENRRPELRELLLEYGLKRIKDEFTEDQFLIRFYSLKLELIRMINSYLERTTGFGLITDLRYENSEPCSYFKDLKKAELQPEIAPVMGYIAETGMKLCSLKDELSEFINEKIKVLMPNTSRLIGEELTLELLQRSGGLKNLIKYPASTIQVLGAERSFFKHMRSGTPPPKHGIIFKYPGISSLPPKLRGKASRTLANKIAITVRVDYFKGSMNVEEIKEAFEKRLKDIKK